MAIKILGFMNKVINDTTSKILDDHVINKITNVIGTFFTSSVETIKEATKEEVPTKEESTPESTP